MDLPPPTHAQPSNLLRPSSPSVVSRSPPPVPQSCGRVTEPRWPGSPELVDGSAVFRDVGEVQGLVPVWREKEERLYKHYAGHA